MAKISDVERRLKELALKRGSSKGLTREEGIEERNLNNTVFLYKHDPDFKRSFNSGSNEYYTQRASQEFDVAQAQKVLDNPQATAGETLSATKTIVNAGGKVSIQRSTFSEEPVYVDERGFGYSIAPELVNKSQDRRDFELRGQPVSFSRVNSFNREAESQQNRQRAFEQSQGLKNVRDTANFLSLGGGTPYEKRSFAGKTAENVVYGFTGGPIEFGGLLGQGVEKSYLTAKALTIRELRPGVFQELQRSGKETFKSFNPKTPEGASTLISAGLIALPISAGKVSFSRNKAVFSEFQDVSQVKFDVLNVRDVSRESSQRVIKSNVLPKADFLSSEIVKSKRTTISLNPKELYFKFELNEPKRSGVRTVVQNIDTGAISMTERIQVQGRAFRNSQDYIKFIESRGNNEFNVRVFSMNDYLKGGKPLINKNFVDKSFSRTLATSREKLAGFMVEKDKSTSKKSGFKVTKDQVFGEYLQSTEVSFEVSQKIKLDRNVVVFSDKELGFSLSNKGQRIAPIEKYYTQKARAVFGAEKLDPNTIFREGNVVKEVKYPQSISESFITKNIDISIRKLSKNELESFSKEETFSKTSLFGGRLVIFKNVDFIEQPPYKTSGIYLKEYFDLTKKMSRVKETKQKYYSTKKQRLNKRVRLETALSDYRAGKISGKELDNIRAIEGIWGAEAQSEARSIAYYDYKQKRIKLVDEFKANFGGMKTSLIDSKRGQISLSLLKLDEIQNKGSVFNVKVSPERVSAQNIGGLQLKMPSFKQSSGTMFSLLSPRTQESMLSSSSSLFKQDNRLSLRLEKSFDSESRLKSSVKQENILSLRLEQKPKQIFRQEERVLQKQDLFKSLKNIPLRIAPRPRPLRMSFVPPLIVFKFPKSRKVSSRKKRIFSKPLELSDSKRRLNILPSLREVFIYESKTGRPAPSPKKTKRIRSLFESQYFGRGNFNAVIPTEAGRLKRKL